MSIEWLAGILEGEGCFDAQSARFGSVRARLVMTDLDVVQRAAAFPGASTISERRVKNYKPQFHTSWHAADAVSLCRALLPHLGIRRSERVHRLLADYYERAMSVCRVCGREFSQPPSCHDRKVCGPDCARSRQAAHNAAQNTRRRVNRAR